ncbi:MAG: sigma-70 family RNA polymerase sigma factor [Chloroflexota bacterium]
MLAMSSAIGQVGGPPTVGILYPDEFVTDAHRAHAAMAYAVALRATRDPELAEDVTQEAFVKLLVEARAGRYPDRAGAWLYRAVTNLVISRARRAAVARRLAPRLAEVIGPEEPDRIALRHEDRHELESALETLSVDERCALLMAADGASGLEIAARLGKSHGATRALICRARTRLRGQAAVLPLEMA